MYRTRAVGTSSIPKVNEAALLSVLLTLFATEITVKSKVHPGVIAGSTCDKVVLLKLLEPASHPET